MQHRLVTSGNLTSKNMVLDCLQMVGNPLGKPVKYWCKIMFWQSLHRQSDHINIILKVVLLSYSSVMCRFLNIFSVCVVCRWISLCCIKIGYNEFLSQDNFERLAYIKENKETFAKSLFYFLSGMNQMADFDPLKVFTRGWNILCGSCMHLHNQLMYVCFHRHPCKKNTRPTFASQTLV